MAVGMTCQALITKYHTLCQAGGSQQDDKAAITDTAIAQGRLCVAYGMGNLLGSILGGQGVGTENRDVHWIFLVAFLTAATMAVGNLFLLPTMGELREEKAAELNVSVQAVEEDERGAEGSGIEENETVTFWMALSRFPVLRTVLAVEFVYTGAKAIFLYTQSFVALDEYKFTPPQVGLYVGLNAGGAILANSLGVWVCVKWMKLSEKQIIITMAGICAILFGSFVVERVSVGSEGMGRVCFC